jgi:hypothetical protein
MVGRGYWLVGESGFSVSKVSLRDKAGLVAEMPVFFYPCGRPAGITQALRGLQNIIPREAQKILYNNVRSDK